MRSPSTAGSARAGTRRWTGARAPTSTPPAPCRAASHGREAHVVRMVVGHEDAAQRPAAEHVLLELQPGVAADVVGHAGVHQQPAVAVVEQPDVDVVELHRQRDAQPQHAVGDRSAQRPAPAARAAGTRARAAAGGYRSPSRVIDPSRPRHRDRSPRCARRRGRRARRRARAPRAPAPAGCRARMYGVSPMRGSTVAREHARLELRQLADAARRRGRSAR